MTNDAKATFTSIKNPDARTKKRNAAEKRFRAYGLLAVAVSVVALLFLLNSIWTKGSGAFYQTYLTVPVTMSAEKLDPKGNRDPDEMKKVTTIGYSKLIAQNLIDQLAVNGLDTSNVSDKNIAKLLSSESAATLRNQVLADPKLVGQTQIFTFLASGRIDGYFKGRVTMESAALDNNTSPAQLVIADEMKNIGILSIKFNWKFLSAPDASELRPEAAGLGVAILGSAYMMLVVLGLALPLGVAASIYLEEFATKNRWTDVIEVNVSNLAAVPSIVFGILGLAIFINIGGLPQSASIVGGLVLTLMTLPTVIISTRASLQAVPPSIRDGALAVGASKMQSVFHHVLPLAMPGIMTGTIIGVARALGETAPLLLIGMVAFVRDFPASPPSGFFDPATALPVQVYQWTQRADPAFTERASGAIIVLLGFLLVLNSVAIFLRSRFERRW